MAGHGVQQIRVKRGVNALAQMKKMHLETVAVRRIVPPYVEKQLLPADRLGRVAQQYVQDAPADGRELYQSALPLSLCSLTSMNRSPQRNILAWPLRRWDRACSRATSSRISKGLIR